MAKENAFLEKNQGLSEDVADYFDFDELEEKLQSQLEEELADLEFLVDEKEKIGNPDNLGNVILDVVWERFMNQVAVTAGDDFVKENNDLYLDLRKEAHIQTTKNFADGKIATHNTEIDYQNRYDDWQANFQKNDDGSVKTKEDYRTKEQRAVLRTKDKNKDPNGANYNTNYNAREFIDEGRPTGSKTVNKDHTISAAEIIRDSEAAAHMTRDEQAAFANTGVNLLDLDSAANQSKKDSSMTEFLDSKRAGKGEGQTQAEYFGLDEEELRARDKAAREEYEKQKKEAEQRSIDMGKKSQKAEAFRVGKKAVRAVVMNLLADLVKKIIQKLVTWLKSKEKSLKLLLSSIKDAIITFVTDLKSNVVNVADTAATVIATSILGPVVRTIKKAWMFIKQGWASLKQSVEYIRNPKNKKKPIGILMMEVGKIITAGITAVGAIVLGEVIEKGLMIIPVFAIEIPLLGSLANIIGIFMGAVVAGIIGAIAINLIEKHIEKSMKRENIDAQIQKGNKILNLQHKVQVVNEVKLEENKAAVATDIHDRHVAAANAMAESIEKIRENCATEESVQDTFDDIDKLFDELED